jgi:hypothetical protein
MEQSRVTRNTGRGHTCERPWLKLLGQRIVVGTIVARQRNPNLRAGLIRKAAWSRASLEVLPVAVISHSYRAEVCADVIKLDDDDE